MRFEKTETYWFNIRSGLEQAIRQTTALIETLPASDTQRRAGAQEQLTNLIETMNQVNLEYNDWKNKRNQRQA